MELPNKPVSKGNKNLSEFSAMFKTLNPKNPVSKKTKSAENFLFSENIRNKETAINRKGIKIFRGLYIFEIIKIAGIEINTKIKMAARLP
jgi:hypothetical protein